VEWASLERAVLDFHEQPEEIQEYLDIQNRLHKRVADFVADCPCTFINVFDNMTDTVSPSYYRDYCLPIYENYAKQLEGTGKILGIHMDGLLANLKQEIADTPCNVIESFTVPPAGNISLAEAKAAWPDKVVSMNCAPHLHWSEPEEVRKGYEALVEEWGGKTGLILNRSESVPVKTIEAHISAAMDAFGYDKV
jgi:uroporphyrinogen-III decarboxylase